MHHSVGHDGDLVEQDHKRRHEIVVLHKGGGTYFETVRFSVSVLFSDPRLHRERRFISQIGRFDPDRVQLFAEQQFDRSRFTECDKRRLVKKERVSLIDRYADPVCVIARKRSPREWLPEIVVGLLVVWLVVSFHAMSVAWIG